MTPYYEDGLVTLYHARWEDVPPDLLRADVLVTDPPYGMGWDVDTTRFSGGLQAVSRGRDWGAAIEGDDEPFDPTPWLAYPNVVLFGANHYGQHLPVGTTLVWLKRYDDGFGSFLSDAEVAWRKGGHGVYCYRSVRSPGRTHHPTEKPVDVMRWAVGMAGGDGTILDPFVGSGSTLAAAKSLGRRSIGVECIERYCETAARRCSQEVLGLSA